MAQLVRARIRQDDGHFQAVDDKPDPPTEAAGVPALICSSVLSILRTEVFGVHLFGSLATNDFDEGVSDIDILAVNARDLNESELCLNSESCTSTWSRRVRSGTTASRPSTSVPTRFKASERSVRHCR